jgi:hypothetical protein
LCPLFDHRRPGFSSQCRLNQRKAPRPYIKVGLYTCYDIVLSDIVNVNSLLDFFGDSW